MFISSCILLVWSVANHCNYQRRTPQFSPFHHSALCCIGRYLCFDRFVFSLVLLSFLLSQHYQNQNRRPILIRGIWVQKQFCPLILFCQMMLTFWFFLSELAHSFFFLGLIIWFRVEIRSFTQVDRSHIWWIWHFHFCLLKFRLVDVLRLLESRPSKLNLPSCHSYHIFFISYPFCLVMCYYFCLASGMLDRWMYRFLEAVTKPNARSVFR